MKRAFNIVLILTLSLFLGCSEETVDLVGLGIITGRVVETNSFNPVENAKVTISPTNNTVFSDADGYFRIEDVEAGDYSVSSTKEAYLTSFEAATVTIGIEVNVIFEMEDDTARVSVLGAERFAHSRKNSAEGLNFTRSSSSRATP